jgi:glycosyltransferase involved in cell wall biosynthesis
MKVSVAGYQAISILRGGPNTQIRETARHLPASGVEVSFFDPWRPFGAGDADLVHIFAANLGTYHLAREIHALGIPLVVSPIIYSSHSHSFVRTSLAATRLAQRAGRGIWSDYAFAADICSWAKHLVPNTQREADLVAEGLGISREKITVVPNGVDARFASGDPSLFEKRYGLRNFILTVGHTGHERKNVLALIRALGGIDHPAVIVGRIIRSPYGDACVAEARKHPHITLVDGLEPGGEMLASAYAACDTFVLPSLFETPGIAALEAGLAGAKVVITKHGGTDEYFGGHAEYVDPHSVESIREGIRRALGRKKGGELAARIRERYLWERVAEQTAAVYRRVAGPRR